MLNYKDASGLVQDCLENREVFIAVKQYVDWALWETTKGIFYGLFGLSVLASLGYLVG